MMTWVPRARSAMMSSASDASQPRRRPVRLSTSVAEPILMTEPCYAQKSPANGLAEHGNVRLSQYMEDCRQVAAKRDVILIDNFEKWSAALTAGQAIEEWTTDGYHPNPRGHREIADAMFEPLAKAVSGARLAEERDSTSFGPTRK